MPANKSISQQDLLGISGHIVLLRSVFTYAGVTVKPLQFAKAAKETISGYI